MLKWCGWRGPLKKEEAMEKSKTSAKGAGKQRVPTEQSRSSTNLQRSDEEMIQQPQQKQKQQQGKQGKQGKQQGKK